ncbi:MAG: class II aldolase/adducin family protein [Coriobacteriia bacterium]|nr:class II aldolase/adducin family protein [Coriobacteriia bacterium]
MIDREIIRQFRDIGRDVFVSGLTTSHGGNMSVRDGERIIITRRGSMLGRLTDDDLIETGMEPSAADDRCSREIVVHRAIYAATEARAIVHAHPVHTIARSFACDSIVPEDSEGLFVLGDVPVVEAATTIASAEAAEVLARALGSAPVAVLRTHGPFATGATLEEAFMHVSVLEASAAVLDLVGR